MPREERDAVSPGQRRVSNASDGREHSGSLVNVLIFLIDALNLILLGVVIEHVGERSWRVHTILLYNPTRSWSEGLRLALQQTVLT